MLNLSYRGHYDHLHFHSKMTVMFLNGLPGPLWFSDLGVSRYGQFCSYRYHPYSTPPSEVKKEQAINGGSSFYTKCIQVSVFCSFITGALRKLAHYPNWADRICLLKSQQWKDWSTAKLACPKTVGIFTHCFEGI